MKGSILFATILACLTSLPCNVGCNRGEETVAPQKMEESRQQMIKRTERIRQDINKK